MIAKRRLAAMRRMYAEFLRVLDLSEQGDEEATEQVMVLGGALIGLMPALLDEVERLSRKSERAAVFLFDPRGGHV